jgi:hypothetical protein
VIFIYQSEFHQYITFVSIFAYKYKQNEGWLGIRWLEGPHLPLSGFRLFMLFGKIATSGFFTTRFIKLRCLQKNLNSKRIGSWNYITFYSTLITLFGGWIFYAILKQLGDFFTSLLFLYSKWWLNSCVISII